MFDNYLELHIIFKTDYASLLANKLFWKIMYRAFSPSEMER